MTIITEERDALWRSRSTNEERAGQAVGTILKLGIGNPPFPINDSNLRWRAASMSTRKIAVVQKPLPKVDTSPLEKNIIYQKLYERKHTVTTAIQPLQHAALSDVAFNEIRRRIISLQFQPGMRLNIDRLAKELGISPTPLREALNRLAALKLIRVEAYKGFSVEPLLDPIQLSNLAAVRRLLESYALERFSGAPDPKILAALHDDVKQMEKLAKGRSFDGIVFNEMDRRFHERIVAAANNEVLLDSYKALNVHIQIARLFQQRAAKHALAANLEHRRLIDALERADTQGSLEALRIHLDNGLERLVTLIRDRTQAPIPVG
ncbi:GntR family transcriptional regulator [Microvirga vignae]|uniref:GntR family transcriptional regulator n=1 Tax=Microvirga vignae TaxID=1225564 RepID=UPI000AE88DF2|nr:GntR family transcriptional regulator [Microvirga vignae]